MQYLPTLGTLIAAYFLAVGIYFVLVRLLAKAAPSLIVKDGAVQSAYLPVSLLMWIVASAAAASLFLAVVAPNYTWVTGVLGALICFSAVQCYVQQRPSQTGLLSALWICGTILGVAGSFYLYPQR